MSIVMRLQTRWEWLGQCSWLRFFLQTDNSANLSTLEAYAELQLLITPANKWLDKLRACLPSAGKLAYFRMDRVFPSSYPTSPNYFGFVGLSTTFDAFHQWNFDTAIIKWIAGLEDQVVGWTEISPVGQGTVLNGTVRLDLTNALTEFAEKHRTPGIGLSGNVWNGAHMQSDGVPLPIVAFEVNPFSGRNRMRRGRR